MFGRTSSPVFAGRDTELSVLFNALSAVKQGGGPVSVLVGGEAGCGKTRLVREFASRAIGDDTPLLVLSGECPDVGASGLPYAPFAGALRALLRQRSLAEVTGLVPEESTAELAMILPEFGLPARADEFGFARSRLFGVLLTLLEGLAVRQPIVLLVEDLHWADGPSRDLLSFLARNLRDAAVLLVGTFRSDEIDGAHPLRRFLAEIGRLPGTSRIELGRLSPAEVAAQIEGMLGHPPAPSLVSAVYERSDGNPLFTEAVLNSDGTVDAGVPRSLEDLLAARLNDLPPETQRVLQAVAVDGGVNIAHGLLAKVTGLDDRQLSNALRPAITAHVLMVDEDRYAFRHGLIRSVVHRQLLVGERARLHRAFAQTLEIVPSLASHPLPSVQIAMHWRAAGEYERALPVAWQAANAARSTFAYATQLQMLEETLQLWHEVPDASRETGVDRITVIDRALDAAQLAGEPQRGLILLEDAWSDREGDDPERSAQLLRSRAALRQQLLLPGQVDDLRAALRLADGPTRTRAQILGLLIRALRVLDHDDEADALALEMLELATRLDDDELVLEASIRSAAVDARASDDGVTEMQRLIENAQRLGSGDLEVLARVLMTYALEGRGDHEAAVAAGRDGLARAQQLGLSRYVTAPIAQNLVESLTSTGAWDDALEVADETLRLDPAPYGRAFLLVSRCQIDLARGDLETAQRELNELVSLLPTDEASTELALPVVCLRMELLLAEGDLEPALATARAFAEEPSGTDPRYLWPALTTAMRVCADAAGRPRLSRDATTVRHTITELTKQLAQPSRLARAHAAVMVAEAARADRRPSPAAWQAAAHDWQAVGQPYALGYALLRGSEAAAMEGDREAAGERVVQSATIASRLRARRLLDQAVQHARRARLQLPPDLVPPGTASADAPLGLTSRETDVLRLVAAGHSNKRIGAELFISPKTASVHVSRILTKLGVATRTEAAAAAHRLGLVDAD